MLLTSSATPDAVPALYPILEALATVATAFVALYLLGQGQKDRRALREEERRRQASKVTLSAGLDAMFGTTLSIFNESDQVIHLHDTVRLVRGFSWDNLQERGLRLQEIHDVPISPLQELLRPRESRELALEGSWLVETGVGGDFAIVEFRDASGLLWRRRSDDLRLEGLPRSIAPGQARLQKLCRHVPLVEHAVIRPTVWLAIRAARRHQDRVPLSLRLHVFLWGYWGAGEVDDWLIPEGAPPLYRFMDLCPPPRHLTRAERRANNG